MEVAISLGSNLGNRLRNLQSACRRIASLRDTAMVARSAVYKTEPVGVDRKYSKLPFLNAVVVIETSLLPRALIRETRRIEKSLGRPAKRRKNLPRTIDLDIIYAGKEIVREKDLVIPHPRWAKRKFVVKPLSDVRPHLVLP
mgnify:CR=1 FL=1